MSAAEQPSSLICVEAPDAGLSISLGEKSSDYPEQQHRRARQRESERQFDIPIDDFLDPHPRGVRNRYRDIVHRP